MPEKIQSLGAFSPRTGWCEAAATAQRTAGPGKPSSMRCVLSEDCGCHGVWLDWSYPQQGKHDACIVVYSGETGTVKSPGEPGTGSGELAKCRLWPSDFQEPSKLKGDKEEGEKKRPERSKQEREELHQLVWQEEKPGSGWGRTEEWCSAAWPT